VGDALGKVVLVVMVVCLIGMAVTSFRTLNHTSRTNEPAPRSMRVVGLPFVVVGLAAAVALLVWG
jgi:uncharacterized membrane protein YidH (DUF202 family)